MLKPFHWKQYNYLVHRWIGLVLGVMVFVWFVSGIVMMYYPYPVLTDSEKRALLHTFEPESGLVGFGEAYRAALQDYAKRGHPLMRDPESSIVGGRLRLWAGRLVYQLRHQRGYRVKAFTMVDGRTGRVLTPISSQQAAEVAQSVVGRATRLVGVDLLPRGDHYMFYGSYHLEEFPVYRVRFADDAATAVYLGQETANVYGIVDRVTRWTTWTGTVPHWLYFMWLYQHPGLWLWINLLLPSVATIAALTGVILGVYQLFPWRGRGRWQMSGYQGMSKWHHVSGVVFGLMVLVWTFSGVLEVLGESADPRSGQAEKARGGKVRWEKVALGEAEALARLRHWLGGQAFPVAVDLEQVEGKPGYIFLLQDGRDYWVDAETGEPRGQLDSTKAQQIANRIVVNASVSEADIIEAYDTYYYARHGREMHLPAWRVTFDNPERSQVYLDSVSGRLVGYVNTDTRVWRWARDGLHSLDFPALLNRRPLWDVVVLPLMIGGTIASFTGVWLVVRRTKRMAAAHTRPGARA